MAFACPVMAGHGRIVCGFRATTFQTGAKKGCVSLSRIRLQIVQFIAKKMLPRDPFFLHDGPSGRAPFINRLLVPDGPAYDLAAACDPPVRPGQREFSRGPRRRTRLNDLLLGSCLEHVRGLHKAWDFCRAERSRKIESDDSRFDPLGAPNRPHGPAG